MPHNCNDYVKVWCVLWRWDLYEDYFTSKHWYLSEREAYAAWSKYRAKHHLESTWHFVGMRYETQIADPCQIYMADLRKHYFLDG